MAENKSVCQLINTVCPNKCWIAENANNRIASNVAHGAKFQLVKAFLVSGSSISAKSLFGHYNLTENCHAYSMYMCRVQSSCCPLERKYWVRKSSTGTSSLHLLHSCITCRYTYTCSTQLDSPLQSPSITLIWQRSKVEDVAKKDPMITIKIHPPPHPVPPVTYGGGAKIRQRREKIKSKENSAFMILVYNKLHLIDTRILSTKLFFLSPQLPYKQVLDY